MGGISFTEARRRLFDARSREAIVEETVAFVRARLRYAAVFVVTPEQFVGLDAWGTDWGEDRARIRGVRVSRTLHSFLALSVAGRAPRLGPAPAWAVNRLILEDMGRDGRGGLLVAPVFMRGRPVLVIYGDNAPETVPSEVASQIIAFAGGIPAAVERMQARRSATAPVVERTQAGQSATAPVVRGTLVDAPAPVPAPPSAPVRAPPSAPVRAPPSAPGPAAAPTPARTQPRPQQPRPRRLVPQIQPRAYAVVEPGTASRSPPAPR